MTQRHRQGDERKMRDTAGRRDRRWRRDELEEGCYDKRRRREMMKKNLDGRITGENGLAYQI